MEEARALILHSTESSWRNETAVYVPLLSLNDVPLGFPGSLNHISDFFMTVIWLFYATGISACAELQHEPAVPSLSYQL